VPRPTSSRERDFVKIRPAAIREPVFSTALPDSDVPRSVKQFLEECVGFDGFQGHSSPEFGGKSSAFSSHSRLSRDADFTP